MHRTALFVGALAGGAFQAALDSGADIVCLDLEDAVPPDRKAEARAVVPGALGCAARARPYQVAVRINSLRSRDGVRDILACLESEAGRPDALVLPKIESADEVRWAGALVDEADAPVDLYAIIETTAALEHCLAIAGSHGRLRGLFFGGFDLSTALGCEMDWEPLWYARSRVVHAAASAGIEVLDSPFPQLDDLRGLRAAAERAKALGMTGKAAKHASQIPVLAEVFTPTAEEIARARAILDLFDADPTQPLVVDGRLIELPTIKRYRRIRDARPAGTA